MSDSSADRDPLERLADEFVARYRRGERPSLTEYANRLPDRAAEVRDLFPALVEFEQLKPDAADSTVESGPRAGPADPDRVGEFRILRRVGQGGMGVVYEAVQESLGRHVALKVLPAEALADPKRLERFRREARAAARLHHTNIVPVFGTGEADGRHYYVMQFIAGHPLDQVIDEVRRLKGGKTTLATRAASEIAAAMVTATFNTGGDPGEPGVSATGGRSPVAHVPGSPSSLSVSETGRHYWGTVARVGAQVADALAYAHAQGILHRDIKPANLLLDLRGTVWVADFGLAKAADAADLTHAGDVVGTLRYMAPERFEGQGDQRADTYALGLTLYELLALRPAFDAESRAKLVEQVIAAHPTPPRAINPAIPRDLETVVLKAIAHDPEERYQSAADLADDLRRFTEDRPIRARRASQTELAWRWCRRNPAVASLIAAVLLVLAGGAAVSGYFAVAARREAAAARAAEATATTARDEANVARDEARGAAAESRRRLVRQNILTGGRYLDAGDPAAALLWFHRAWELDADPADEASHRTRIASLLAQTPELLGVCFHPTKVCDAVFSPDGTRVLARTDGAEAFVWDYATGRPALLPLRHAGRIRHVCYSPDGGTIATASADGTAALWDAGTGAKLHTLPHDGPLTWVEFDPKGTIVLTTAEDKTLRLWDVKSGRRLDRAFPATGDVIEHATFSPDGTRLVVTRRSGADRVWSVEPFEPLSPEFPQQVSDETQRYLYNYDSWPRFSTDGKTLVTFKGKQVRFWSGGDPVTIDVPLFILEAYFLGSSDRVLLTGAHTNAVIVGRAEKKVLHTLPHPRNANIGGASRDGRLVLTSSSGGVIHLWNAATGQPAWVPQRCGDFASALAFDPTGAKCLAASQDGTVRVWATGGKPKPLPYRFDDGRANVPFSVFPNGSRGNTSPDGRGRVVFLGPDPPKLVPAGATEPVPLEAPPGLTRAQFCDDGTRVILSAPEAVAAADARTGKLVQPAIPITKTEQPVSLKHVSHDGSRVAVWDDPKTLSVWDLTTGQRVFGPTRNDNPGPLVFGPPAADGHVREIALSPNGRRLAALTESSGTLTVYDVDSGAKLHHARWFRGTVRSLGFSADGRRVFAWTSDHTARVFDAETGRPIGAAVRTARIRLDGANTAGLIHCDLSPDGRQIVAYDPALPGVRMWDVAGGDQLLSVPTPGALRPTALWFAADGSRFSLVAGDGRSLTVPVPRFTVPPESVGPLARLLTGQQLDDNDGLEFVDQGLFRRDPDTYRRAYEAWKR
jgi:serine/threonine protein kinase/WD40 repeat protein